MEITAEHTLPILSLTNEILDLDKLNKTKSITRARKDTYSSNQLISECKKHGLDDDGSKIIQALNIQISMLLNCSNKLINFLLYITFFPSKRDIKDPCKVE
eukprot:303093_1